MRTGFTNRPGITYEPLKLDRIFAEDMQDLANFINAGEYVKYSVIEKIWLNITLAFFKLAVHAGLSKFNLVDGFIDEYEDQTGVDIANSTYIAYNDVDDYYYPFENGGVGVGLLLHWKMNDNAANTTVVDNIGGYNGTARANTSSKTVAGKINNALQFTAQGDYITSPQLPAVSNPTFSMWLNFVSHSEYMSILQQTTTSLQVYTVNSGKIEGYINGGTGGYFKTANVFPSGGWHHLIIARLSTGYWKIYFDNVEQTLTINTSGTDALSAYGLVFGHQVGQNRDFNGKMDDFRLYSGAVTSAMRDLIYNGGDGTENDSTSSTVENMTLISNSTTAENTPVSTRIVIFEQDVDAITLNTDLKAYVSCNGTDYEQITLADGGDYETGCRVLSGHVANEALSATTIKYKLMTFNNKKCKIHGTSVQWD